MDVGAVFPVQNALCFGTGFASLAEMEPSYLNGSSTPSPASNVTGAAGMVNAMVGEMMPEVHAATEAFLTAATLTVALAIAALLVAGVGTSLFVDDSPRKLLGVVLVGLTLSGVVFELGENDPLAGAAGALVVLLLFSTWRLLACSSACARRGLRSRRGAQRLALLCAALCAMAWLCHKYRGATGARWLFLLYMATCSAALAALVTAPYCTWVSLQGVREVSASTIAAASSAPAGVARKSSGAAAFRQRLAMFDTLNRHAGGLPHCYVSMLVALVLAGFVIVFSMLKFSRDLHGMTHFVSPPPPPAPL